jgi:hypothetical protein
MAKGSSARKRSGGGTKKPRAKKARAAKPRVKRARAAKPRVKRARAAKPRVKRARATKPRASSASPRGARRGRRSNSSPIPGGASSKNKWADAMVEAVARHQEKMAIKRALSAARMAASSLGRFPDGSGRTKSPASNLQRHLDQKHETARRHFPGMFGGGTGSSMVFRPHSATCSRVEDIDE